MRPTHLSKDGEARLEKAVEQLMAEYNGDVVQVIKALLIANGYLQDKLEQIATVYPDILKISHDGEPQRKAG